jgi:hypothetical protein
MAILKRGAWPVRAREGHRGVNSTKTILGLVLAAALMAGCGGLDSPDLETGQVSGRLTGDFKKGAAFAYAFGAPETKVPIADDGSYTLNRVPVASNGNVPSGKTQVVIFDGDKRADFHVADVKPASRTQADDRDAGTLAVARSVVTAARCSGGASAAQTVYTVLGAALKDDAKGDVATLFPLPPGVFKVRARLAGFKDKVEDVDVTSPADVQLELQLDVDEGDQKRGCLANGCTGGRECDDRDGQCYACTNDAQCVAGQKCDDHVCVGGTGRHVCEPCTSSTQCELGPLLQAAACIGPAGAGTCSYTCNATSECPTGFTCDPQGGVNACVPSGSCSAFFAGFGSSCLNDPGCPLLAPVCHKASGATLGQCTASCQDNSGCPESLGYKCDVKGINGGSPSFLCVKGL